jgi:hypothetical protein
MKVADADLIKRSRRRAGGLQQLMVQVHAPARQRPIQADPAADIHAGADLRKLAGWRHQPVTGRRRARRRASQRNNDDGDCSKPAHSRPTLPGRTRGTLAGGIAPGPSVNVSTFIDLRGRAKGTYKVKVTATTTDGRVLAATRRYHTCARSGRLTGGIPTL